MEMEGGSHSSASSTCYEDVEHVNTVTSVVDPVDKFRSYLLLGNKVEGLEYAMKEGPWGHALFLASKMDQGTYAEVMTRFTNGLAINDPLQTLYQLMTARMPSAMKQCADQVRILLSIFTLHTLLQPLRPFSAQRFTSLCRNLGIGSSRCLTCRWDICKLITWHAV